jgi:Protein-L-isoaspartate(D-aspartate) O-methyltransferase (PCMT)
MGYFTALIAHCVGETGHVVGLELDPQLATRARENLKQRPQVEILCADATTYDAGKVDAIRVNAGASFPCPRWLDSLKPLGTLILPYPWSDGQREADLDLGLPEVVRCSESMGKGTALQRGFFPISRSFRAWAHSMRKPTGCWPRLSMPAG